MNSEKPNDSKKRNDPFLRIVLSFTGILFVITYAAMSYFSYQSRQELTVSQLKSLNDKGDDCFRRKAKSELARLSRTTPLTQGDVRKVQYECAEEEADKIALDEYREYATATLKELK